MDIINSFVGSKITKKIKSTIMKKKASFKDLINGDKPVLVQFSAEWCGPCKAMAPIVSEVARKVGSKATILKIDVDRNRAVATKYAIRSVPTFMMFQNGKIQWQAAGMQSAHALVQLLEGAAVKS